MSGELEEVDLEPWAVDLQPSDREFVREFLVDLNAYQACIRCGIPVTTSSGWGTRKIRRPKIAKAIAAAMHERAEALGITAKTVLGEAFRCYLAAVGDRNWNAAARFLDMVGRHVDVDAFRARVGYQAEEDDGVNHEALASMTTEELETLARLSRKARGEADDGSSLSDIGT